MKKSTLRYLVLVLSLAASAQAAAGCAAPVFPPQSVSSEGVRRVEKQVAAYRTCMAQRGGQQEAVLIARQTAELDANYGKWAAATRMYSNGQLSGASLQASRPRDEREDRSSRSATMRPVYGSERK